MFKKFFVTIALTFGFSVIAALAAAPVFADQNCGPYGVCSPDTDIVVGDFVITDEAIAALALSYMGGVGLIANAQFLKGKVLPNLK